MKFMKIVLAFLLLGLAAATPQIDPIYSQDYGNYVHRSPALVVKPNSNGHLSAVLRTMGSIFKTPITIRGNAHTTYGQAQGEHLVVDITNLDSIQINTESDGSHTMTAGGGAFLEDLVAAAAAQGLGLPVLTDYLKLTVGGVLSNGGIGGMSFRHGLVVNTVLELKVATVAGGLVTCSPTQNANLFKLVLGGLGQYGVIAEAKFRLSPVDTYVAKYDLAFPSLAALTAAQKSIIAQHEAFVAGTSSNDVPYIYAEGFVFPLNTEGLAAYSMELVQPLSAPAPVFADALSSTFTNMSYVDFANRLSMLDKPAIGSSTTNPWFDAFIPCKDIEAYMARNMQAGRLFTHPSNIEQPVLYYPVPLRAIRASPNSVVLPAVDADETCMYIVATLGSADISQFANVVTLARENIAHAHANFGAVAYPVGAPDYTQNDWINLHYGQTVYNELQAEKQFYDSDNILNNEQRVF